MSDKHFVHWPNEGKCVHWNMEFVHLLVLMRDLDCLQALLCQCVLLLWSCLHWTLMEEVALEGSINGWKAILIKSSIYEREFYMFVSCLNPPPPIEATLP